jgi:hypothetical protein
MKILITLFLCVIISQLAFSFESLQCKAQYLQKIYHPGSPPKVVGQTGGKKFNVNLYDNGTSAYYSYEWTPLYTLEIVFATGSEVNIALNKNYNETAIIGIVKWSNGGLSFVKLSSYILNELVLTNENFSIPLLQQSVNLVKGIDEEGREWEINL